MTFSSRNNAETIALPKASARGRVRSGFRTSSATYVASFQPLYPNVTHSKLTTNCDERLDVDVRSAGSEKWLQLPAPNPNPSTRNETSTISLVEVRTFCTLAARPMPKQFKVVNAAMSRDATSCPGPNRNEKSPEPITTGALASFSAGKK